jgi:hypothetical protein
MLQTGPTEQEQEVMRAHSSHAARFATEGKIFLIDRTQIAPDTMGLAMFFAETEEEARTFMDSDPAIAGGVMTGELFPYKVAFGNVESFAGARGK